MNYRSWMGVLSIAVLSMALLTSGSLHADTARSDDYSLEDFNLNTADDLFDVCSLTSTHSDHSVAMAFCYGFFEGAAHYDDTLAESGVYNDIVCTPDTVTRTQAVAVFIQYIQANPQYGSEPPIDAIFRALVARWPCAG